MVQKIVWLPTAQFTYIETLKYLEEEFSEKEIEKFVDRILQKIMLLRSFPTIGNSCNKPNIYKTVVHKKVLLFYQYKPVKNEILLLGFWNTMQDPGKLKW